MKYDFRFALIVGSITTTVLIACYVVSDRQGAPSASIPAPVERPVRPTSEIFAQKDAQIVADWTRVLEKSKAATADPRREHVRTRQEQATSVLAASFKTALKLQGYVNRDTILERMWSDALVSYGDATITVAEETLLSRAGAVKNFGSEQAIGRFYSIKFLEFAARHGQKEPLRVTTNGLASRLAERAEDDEELSKGELRDLSDLVIALVNIEGPGGDEGTIRDSLAAAGYRSQYPSAVRDVFDEAFFFALKRQFGRERAGQLLAKVFEETKS